MPAAGKASRLNLTYSKEIHKVKNVAAIDYSFQHFKDISKSNIEFVIIINSNKLDIYDHCSKYDYNIKFVTQNLEFPEYTGAILSATNLLGKNNLVLLPDSYIECETDYDLYRDTLATLSTDPFVFWAQYTNEANIIRTKGALRIEKETCFLYEDKPKINCRNYNAYWCSFGFTDKSFDGFIDYFHDSALGKNSVFEQTIAYNSKCLPVKNYYDFGTWEEIKKFEESNRCAE